MYGADDDKYMYELTFLLFFFLPAMSSLLIVMIGSLTAAVNVFATSLTTMTLETKILIKKENLFTWIVDQPLTHLVLLLIEQESRF